VPFLPIIATRDHLGCATVLPLTGPSDHVGT